jgi:hypothetical protein
MSSSNLLSTPKSVSALQTSESPEPEFSVNNEVAQISITSEEPEPFESAIPRWQIQFLPEYRRTYPQEYHIW